MNKKTRIFLYGFFLWGLGLFIAGSFGKIILTDNYHTEWYNWLFAVSGFLTIVEGVIKIEKSIK